MGFIPKAGAVLGLAIAVFSAGPGSASIEFLEDRGYVPKMTSPSEHSPDAPPAPELLGRLVRARLFFPNPCAPVAAGQDALAIPGPADIETALIRAINEERRAAGVGELRVSPDLAAAARDHSRTMAAASVLSHSSPDGRSPTMRLVLAGIFFSASGENVASSAGFNAVMIHRALMESPEHRSNILDPEFNMAGIGVAGKWPGPTYVTQDFIHSLRLVPEAVVVERARRTINGRRAAAGLRPLISWPVADEFARPLCVVESAGSSRPPFPDRLGETRALLMSGPEPFRDIALTPEVMDAELTHVGAAAVFARTISRPGGAYFSALLLASEARYDKPGAELAVAVLNGLNARRLGQGRAPLVRTVSANEIARRVLGNTAEHRTPWPGLKDLPTATDILSYLTFNPDVVPDSVLGLLLNRNPPAVGIAAVFERPPDFPRGILRVVIILPANPRGRTAGNFQRSG
jgi:hypothetical protein